MTFHLDLSFLLVTYHFFIVKTYFLSKDRDLLQPKLLLYAMLTPIESEKMALTNWLHSELRLVLVITQR